MKTFPVLWQGNRVYRERLEAAGCPREVPWDFVAPHERQAMLNHGQTVQRLAERGGLSPVEMFAVVTGRSWHKVAWNDEGAVSGLLQLLAAFKAQHEARDVQAGSQATRLPPERT